MKSIFTYLKAVVSLMRIIQLLLSILLNGQNRFYSTVQYKYFWYRSTTMCYRLLQYVSRQILFCRRTCIVNCKPTTCKVNKLMYRMFQTQCLDIKQGFFFQIYFRKIELSETINPKLGCYFFSELSEKVSKRIIFNLKRDTRNKEGFFVFLNLLRKSNFLKDPCENQTKQIYTV